MRQVRVKICGITRIEDAIKAAEFGADAIGFVFYEGSPRHIFPETAREIIQNLPPFITTVGVFVNEHPSEINKIVQITGLDIIQLHGDEPPELCGLWPRVIKAFRIRELTDLNDLNRYRVSAYLLDSYSPDAPGGTGITFNWDIAARAKAYGRIILAGGLNPDNIAEAVRTVRPYAVDVSSGVEADKGIKDHDKLKRFISSAKSVLL